MDYEFKRLLAAYLKSIEPKTKKIYTDSVKQGLVTPCFFIIDISKQGTNALLRKNVIGNYVVSYIGDNRESVEEALLLLDCIDCYRLTDKEIEINDDVLQFSFTVSVRYEVLSSEEKMQKIEEGVKMNVEITK
ncbi:phage tail terminator family protein [Dielma fastidiosa]|uniref:phage tail terminator family protein n=1 Tax=Dielma fastidiosa TaxID=1034346 RepID=UPI000EDCAB3F|nr:hypothetical protein [Dielma fastidiosa]HAH93965.1 hypothetical protein [Dielma fastidiosa]